MGDVMRYARAAIRRVTGLVRRAWTLLRRGSFERDMDEEMRHHLELEIRDRIRSGMTPREARRTALRDFGGVERFKERAREARGLAPFDALVQDLIFGFRVLRRRPLFAFTATLTLGIGIGFATGAFGLANAVALRPVPGVVDEERVARLRFVAEEVYDERGLSYPNYVDLRAADLPAVEELFAWQDGSFQVAVGGGGTATVRGAAVAGDYFGALGVAAGAGRLIGAEETLPGHDEPVVVLSERLARDLFSEAWPVGRSIILNGLSFTVIGVAGGGFRGVELRGDAELWIPFPLYPRVRHFPPTYDLYGNRAPLIFHDFGVRLAPGRDAPSAEAQLRGAMARLVSAHPDVNDPYTRYEPELSADIAVHPADRARLIETLRLLMGAVGLLLLVACANVANLLIFNGVRRRGESAVRRTLGASRGRLLRQHLTESALLAGAGTLLGVGLAHLTFRIVGLRAEASASAALRAVDATIPTLDLRVLVFAAGVCALSVVLSGLAPAWVVHRVSLSESMKASSATQTGRAGALRSFLTVVQLALSVSLVVGALLLWRTVQSYDRIDPGYDPDGLVRVTLDPGPQGYDDPAVQAYHRDLLDGARALPGIETAAAEIVSFSSLDLRAGDSPAGDFPVGADGENVSPGYFLTLGVPLLAGRDFTRDELEASWSGESGVAIVNEALALDLFGPADAVGRTLVVRGFREHETLEVVGVVGDARERSVTRPAGPVLYRPMGEQSRSSLTLLIRSPRPADDVIEAVREVADRLDPAVPFTAAGTARQEIRRATAQPRFLALLAGVLAGAAAFLAAVGLYGVVGHSVAERRREIGIRMALGARARGVVGAVVGRAFALTLLGLGLGAGLGWFLTRALESRLFGVGVLDPVSWLGAVAIFLLVGPVAAAGPARAAAATDPVRVLKDGQG